MRKGPQAKEWKLLPKKAEKIEGQILPGRLQEEPALLNLDLSPVKLISCFCSAELCDNRSTLS